MMRLEQSAWIFELLLVLLVLAGLETAGLELAKNCVFPDRHQRKDKHKKLIHNFAQQHSTMLQSATKLLLSLQSCHEN